MLTFAQVLPPIPPPTFWEKALDQVPGLAVVCVLMLFVIWQFLRHLTRVGDARDAAMKEISTSCHRVQEELVGRVEGLGQRTNVALDRTYEALGRADALTDEVRTLRADSERHHRESQDAHQSTRHAIREWANAAHLKALEDALRHKAAGLPPGSVVVETIPPGVQREKLS